MPGLPGNLASLNALPETMQQTIGLVESII
jgi:hypothetical protein